MTLLVAVLLQMETLCSSGELIGQLNQHAALKHWEITAPESWHLVKVWLELWCAHTVPRRSVLIRSNHMVNVWKRSIDGNVGTRAG